MKTNKLTLLTVATIATATLGIKGVNADESDRGITPETATIAANQSGEANGTESAIPATETTQPTDSNNDAGTGSAEAKNNEREGLPTNFEKSGNVIEVKNPEVVVDQSNGTGKYQPFSVEYKNVHFPDDLEINEGDKVTFTLPEEVAFQTNFTFDVHNPENAVVGQATADSTAGTVTTVFNDYFKNHPLNKQMSLKMDAKWTDKVQSGKPVTVNFDGTLVTANIGAEQVIGKDELISKWGSQDENDPSVINWTIRLNYARKVLNYVKIIDEMSENQKLVDDYFEIKNIESVDPWIDKGSAMDLVKSISKSDHGFEIKMDRLDRMIYLNYKTKLTSAVKDSVNPTNKVELKAEDSGAVSYSYVQLVGGRGDASGENKPVFEIPNEAPVYDKPSIDLNDIPLMPPAPVVEKPKWKGGTTPFDAPQLDKPEWEGGVVPFDAPILEKPEINIEDIPLLPPAPILEKPELVIDIPQPKQDKPQPKEDKPNTPAPKETPEVEEVKITNRVENHAQNTRNESEEIVEAYSAPATLPNTGSEFGSAISLLGMLGLSLGVIGIAAKKEN
ncbi:MAG: LPXTG cell wall anchor domain-containing protein [Streptococcus parasanguinis]|uniref:LPXTG cell wall anchor domain-containing protein n=1 Tax=Streptococcus parasanguinis TaxID=1318 RepID=A0A943DGX6_STRPA|nr:LPXTG cell wall anchor domain-containing protein [Streptococcus parasanguinis]